MADQKVSDLPSLNGADVDAADLLYIIDSSAGAAGSKKITIGQYQLAPVSGGTANTVVYLNGSKVESSSSALTFDGTNLGIGTSSPVVKLDVNGAAVVRGTFTPTDAITMGGNTSAPTADAFIYRPANNTLAFGTANTERMRLDSSGNLGLGVAPSAWSVIKAIEIGSFRNSIFSDNGGVSVGLASGSYYNSGWKYAVTGSTVGYYEVAGNAHRWFTAPSGTAGNAISFTQAMTLDASGNLLLQAAASNLYIQPSTTTNNALTRAINAGGTAYIGLDSNAGGLGGQYSLNLWHGGNYPIVFATNNSERARITSGGLLLVGTTSEPSIAGVTTDHAFVAGTGNRWVSGFRNTTTGTPWGLAVEYSGAAPNNTSSNFLYCYDSAPALRMSVRSNGGIANYSANDVNLSDRREKTNFAPAKSYLDTICAIPVQTFNYIDQSPDDPGLTLGVVAQDVQAVAPELVMESNWGTEDNPKMRLSIYQTDLQYALMKCIQEQQELIKDLRARVAALEAK